MTRARGRARLLALAVAVAACGVRAPAPIDVAALLARRGPVEARRDLEIRIIADGRDVQARLALAALDDRIGRPGEALEQLDAVAALGGPLGPRWHDDDRARYARLLLARGQARVARHSLAALADLEHARALGAAPGERDLRTARIDVAVAGLRHVDPETRDAARAALAKLPEFRGARAGATPAERGLFGLYAWSVRARREAYEQLAAWHAATPEPRDRVLEANYLQALRWWAPPDAPPPAGELVGDRRCWFTAAGCPEYTFQPPLPAPVPLADPFAGAAARYAHARSPDIAVAELEPIARAFRRDPAIAERLGRELVARTIDGAVAHAALGALFDALGDPGRARPEWQAAVDASPDPVFVRGLAEAAARGGDPPAASVFAVQAAAAWGDPAIVWIGVARVLDDTGAHVEALAAAHSALELAGRDAMPRALDVAIAASRALGRTAQADALAARRAQLAPAAEEPPELAAYRAHPTAETIAQLWVASRTRPRDVALRAALLAATPADDPRHAAVAAELVGLAGDRFADPQDALAAVAALR